MPKPQPSASPPLAGMVDDPGPFGSLEEWERHLTGLRAATLDSGQRLLIEQAEAEIARLKAPPAKG